MGQVFGRKLARSDRPALPRETKSRIIRFLVVHDGRGGGLGVASAGNRATAASGLPPLGGACLVVVDTQRLFCDPESPAFLADWPPRRSRLIALARSFLERGLPVIRTRHVHPDGDDGGTMGLFFRRLQRMDDPLSAPDSVVAAALADVPLVDKSRFSALTVPSVVEAAVVRGTLVLAGVQTHRCILATAVDAARLGLRPIVVSDACAAGDVRDHRAALRVLRRGHAHVATCRQLLRALDREGPA